VTCSTACLDYDDEHDSSVSEVNGYQVQNGSGAQLAFCSITFATCQLEHASRPASREQCFPQWDL
jgi:hypothetical protein